MSGRIAWRRPAVRAKFWPAVRFAGLLLFAVLLGLSTVFLPWFVHLALVMMVIYPIIVFKAPWIAFPLYAVGAFIAPGYKSADALTLITLGLFALRWMSEGRPKLLPRVLARPYLVFLVMVGFAGLVGLARRYPISLVYGDGRGYIYWLWLPVLYSLALATPDGIRKLARAFGCIAAVIALVALVQYATGIQIVAAGRVAGVDGASSAETRVQMHGFLFVSVAAVWALVAVVHSPRRTWWLLPYMLLMFAALYANLGRALWFWTGVALVLSVVAAGWRRGWALALVLTVVTVFGVSGLAIFKPKVIDNIVERADSVRAEGGAKTSYGWRQIENQDALPHIMRSPLVGIGIGAEYRRWMHEVATFEEHTRYVHNTYIFIALKTGIPSVLALLTMLLTAWWRGWRGTRRVDVPQRALRVAAVASFFPLLGISITQPELVSPISVLMFVMLTVLMGSSESRAQPPAVAGPRGVGV